jgi:hypothetical protein
MWSFRVSAGSLQVLDGVIFQGAVQRARIRVGVDVTRAAERLNFSQPSISVHLAKLRDIFGDPLLLPGPRGMRPTARAKELRRAQHATGGAGTAPPHLTRQAEQGIIDLAFHTAKDAPQGLRHRVLFKESPAK